LQVGHANHIRAPTAIDIRFGFSGELRTLHANVGSTELRGHAGGLACVAYHLGHFGADGIAETYVRYYAVAEEGVHAVAGAVEKLGGDYEIEGLVLFFQGAYGGDGDDSFYA